MPAKLSIYIDIGLAGLLPLYSAKSGNLQAICIWNSVEKLFLDFSPSISAEECQQIEFLILLL